MRDPPPLLSFFAFRRIVKFMIGRTGILVVAIVSAFAVGPARADCTCRANGQDYPEGQLACIRLSSGSYVARCGKVLNNTSWIKVSDGCPQADAGEAPFPEHTGETPLTTIARTNG
jgi:hypothetical protein